MWAGFQFLGLFSKALAILYFLNGNHRLLQTQVFIFMRPFIQLVVTEHLTILHVT